MFHINCVIPIGLEKSRCDTFKFTSMRSLKFARDDYNFCAICSST